MKIINPGYEILTPINGVEILKHKLKDIGVDVDEWNNERSSL
jgi:hypothetical protein